MDVKHIPKADMHVHIEGTISPAMVQKLAQKNKVPVPAGLIDDNGDFSWEDDGTAASALVGFLKAYDAATSVMKTAQDYTEITYDYLKRSAAEGCIYAEIFISADHGEIVGLSYRDMLGAIKRGYEKAKAETGIEARFISTCVRHFGPENAMRVAKITRDNPDPMVVGFGMAGDENAYTVAEFKPAFDAAGFDDNNAHAGEAAGPESVRAARDILRVRRFGHMVRADEDAALVREQKAMNAVPEINISSNMDLKVYPTYQAHPLRRFFDAGLKVILGSDDPTFFKTSIGREYQIAHDHFGFTEQELVRLTKNAIEEAFLDADTRKKLLQKIDGAPCKTPISQPPQLG